MNLDQASIETWLEGIVRRVVREELHATPGDDQLLTAEQVAETLGYSDPHSVYRLKREKKLPAVVLGHNSVRFRRSDVRRFIEERMAGERFNCGKGSNQHDEAI